MSAARRPVDVPKSVSEDRYEVGLDDWGDPTIDGRRAIEWSGITMVHAIAQLLAERDALRARLDAIDAAPTVAHMRRWAYEGVKPQKERNANGRMAWPTRFKILPVTVGGGRGVFDDDVELIARPAKGEM